MGLDMFLFKTKGSINDHNTYEEVGYWRKSNQIHNWFVRNVQNGKDECEPHKVTFTDLMALKNTCEFVLSSIDLVKGKITNGQTFVNGEFQDIKEDGKVIANPEIAQKFLPTSEGFFFGSSDYDEYYVQDLQETVKIIDSVLKDWNRDKETIVYQSSW